MLQRSRERGVRLNPEKSTVGATENVKDLITREPGPILAYYDPDKELRLQVDASKYGLGAVLLQEGKPIGYASKSLTDCEINYAQIEKELYAILFGYQPWQVVATDLFTWNNEDYIVTVDYYSRYFELDKLHSTTSAAVIHKLKAAFARHGIATLNDRSSIQKPHLFFLPDVPSIPFFPRDAHRHDIEVLEANYPIILAEFQAVYQRGIDPKIGWTGLGPKGQAVFPLYSAGVCVARNCRSCPCTYRTLLSLRTFISSNSLGSAGFWLLGPGATLGGVYGPTNTRLRCHLGVQTPPQCELVVGGEPQCWSEGHCLLVDDSFLHTVSHNGVAEDGPRVIFSVDLWHPNVAAAERQALDYIFCPDQ
ncbi:aspartate beta-hydroxylase domain-containing protein 2 [Salvelinus namaycush]|uniref:Aspartate beta-hydroxylase domain-containing protein 2 n=1 Tax=Salvelinus namaycush TaxID=8040 RepID=A0A8U0U9J4_SALNM|nr:aspartate beta-hydroxylase domain-containing protein 2 [Salvelinus namaycush]